MLPLFLTTALASDRLRDRGHECRGFKRAGLRTCRRELGCLLIRVEKVRLG